MKKIGWVLILVCAVSLILHQATENCKLMEGSEITYCGTVIDCAMSPIREGSRESRPYIVISTEGEDVLVWEGKVCELAAGLGDKVVVESAVEEKSNLRVATSVAVDNSFGKESVI